MCTSYRISGDVGLADTTGDAVILAGDLLRSTGPIDEAEPTLPRAATATARLDGVAEFDRALAAD